MAKTSWCRAKAVIMLKWSLIFNTNHEHARYLPYLNTTNYFINPKKLGIRSKHTFTG